MLATCAGATPFPPSPIKQAATKQRQSEYKSKHINQPIKRRTIAYQRRAGTDGDKVDVVGNGRGLRPVVVPALPVLTFPSPARAAAGTATTAAAHETATVVSAAAVVVAGVGVYRAVYPPAGTDTSRVTQHWIQLVS